MITDKQRIERRQGIGGSDMPIILGLTNYKTPYQLFLEKKGLLDDADEETQLQYWGHRLEPVIRDEFALRNKVTIEVPETIIHPFNGYMRGNLDGFIPEWNAVFEAKCSTQFMADLWGESNSDIVPLAYLVQVAYYCLLTNADCAHLAVLIGGHDYREYRYVRDSGLENMIAIAAENFWECVQKDIQPPPVNIKDVRLMFPKHSPEKTKTINSYVCEQLTSLREIRAKIKQLDEQQEALRFNIMKHMEDAECLMDEEGKPLVTWKANKKGSRVLLLKGE